MQEKTQTSSNKLIIIITAVTATVIMFIFSTLCPYFSDDWHFFFKWEYFDPINNVERIESLKDIFYSAQNYYNLSGGRVIAHFLTFCVLTADKVVFNILNALIFTAFCWLLYRIANAVMKHDKPWTFPLIVLMTFCFIPVFGDDMLWISGSVNYMWMAVPFLGCILWLLERTEKAGTAEKICIIPLFMFSAATGEITGGMLGVAIILYIIINGKKNIAWLTGYIVSLIPGMWLVLLAPGNQVRKASINSMGGLSFHPKWEVAWEYMYYLFNFNFFLPGIIIFAFILKLYEKGIPWRKRLNDIFLFVVGICGIEALTMTGSVTMRPMFWGFILFIPSAVKSLFIIAEQIGKMKNNLTNAILCCIYAFSFTKGLQMLVAVLYYRLATAIIGVLLIAAPFIIRKIKLSDMESSETKLREFVKKRNITFKKAAAVFLIGLSVVAGKNIFDCCCWASDYNKYINDLVSLCKEEKLTTAVRYPMDAHSGYLSSMEALYVSPGYQVEWIAAYCGTVTDDFVLEYSPTNPELLKEKMGVTE